MVCEPQERSYDVLIQKAHEPRPKADATVTVQEQRTPTAWQGNSHVWQGRQRTGRGTVWSDKGDMYTNKGINVV